MEKKEYIRQRDEIIDKQFKLRWEFRDLEDKYIREAEIQQYKVGEKVMVHSGSLTVPAYVNGYEIDKFSDDVILKLVQCKKDGKPSKIKMTYCPSCGDYVEKIK